MKLLAIIWKDVLVRFSSKVEILFFLLLPVLFTFLLSGVGGPATQKGIIFVVDEDQSLLSSTLVSALQRNDTLQVTLAEREVAEQGFKDRQAVALLIIPNGLNARLRSGQRAELDLRKAQNDTSADAAERAIWSEAAWLNRLSAAALASVETAQSIRPFTAESERETYYQNNLAAAIEAFSNTPKRVERELAVETAAVNLDERTQASIGQLVSWVLIPLLGTSALFAYERSSRTLQRLLTTPTKKSTYLLGTISGQLAVAMVQMAVLILFGVYIMHVPWGGGPPGALAVVMVCFGLASVALGTMLGAFIKTERQATSLSIMLGMLLSLLGGCWWPLEFFPPTMQTIAQLLPTYWAMQAFSNVVLRNQGLFAILPQVGILLGFAGLFFVIGVRRFRYE